MTYESTGEVRSVQEGEWFICQSRTHCNEPLVHRARHNVLYPSVIMRPVEELKKSYKAWSVVIPFHWKDMAESASEEVEEALGFATVVQEVDIYE